MYGLAFAVLALCLVPVGVAQATTFTVDSNDDGPDVNTGNGKCATSVLFPKCTLRAAVMEANGLSGGPHTIIVPAGTYLLSRVSPLPDRIPEGYGPLPIFKSMNITGSGGIAVIRGASGWPYRIFSVPLLDVEVVEDVEHRALDVFEALLLHGAVIHDVQDGFLRLLEALLLFAEVFENVQHRADVRGRCEVIGVIPGRGLERTHRGADFLSSSISFLSSIILSSRPTVSFWNRSSSASLSSSLVR